MRTLLVILALAVFTPTLGVLVIVTGLLGVRDRPGGVFDWAPRLWCRIVLRAAGVRIRLHNEDRMRHDDPRIYVGNHVSWFDIFALASLLPYYKFVAKAELEHIPIFGRAARTANMIFIERENRKAAFTSYEKAAAQIQRGASLVVFPEGTRGYSYALRPFKKGPFVLAIAAQVPLVPMIVHGTIAIQPKGAFRIRSGVVDIHFLEPIDTHGLKYADRDRLAAMTWHSMADAMEREYAITSPGSERSPLVLTPTPDS